MMMFCVKNKKIQNNNELVDLLLNDRTCDSSFFVTFETLAIDETETETDSSQQSVPLASIAYINKMLGNQPSTY